MLARRVAALAPTWGCAALVAASLAASAGFDLDPFDSAELALAAVTAGLAHPPGQPLHTLVGWLLTRGPWRPLAALAWLSIAPAAALIAAGCARGLREPAAAAPSSAPSRETAGASAVAIAADAPPLRAVALAVATALLASALPAVREASTRVEVYALAAALAVAAPLFALRAAAWSELCAGLCLGLSAATNPVIALQGGAGVLWVLLAERSRARDRALALARATAGGLAGLCVYVYPWLAAAREARTMVWGAPRTAGEFVALLTARDFAPNVAAPDPLALLANAARFARDLLRGGALPLFVLGGWGLFHPPRALAGDATVATARRAPLAPLGLACAGCVRLGRALLAHARPARRVTTLLAASLALGALACALAATLASGRPVGATRALATRALADAPPRALVVLASDHLLFPALYLQRVEGVRPDATVLNPGWASSAWAWRWTLARDPSLRVDLTPGIGGAARLRGALASRAPDRAVLAETPGALRGLSRAGVCPAGVLWSTSEGCDARTQARIDGAVALLRALAQRAGARYRGWDGRLVRFTGRTMGDGALGLGCAGLALRYYTAALAQGRPPWAPRRQCDERAARIPPGPPATLLESTPEDVRAAIARLAP